MNYSIMDEVSRNIPTNITKQFGDSALFTAYGCVLLEKESASGYTYRAKNMKTNRSVIVSRRKNPLTTSGVMAITEKIRTSIIAGKGFCEIDMPPGENMMREALSTIQRHIFLDVLPEHGYGIREKQVELADHILQAINRRTVSLSEAEVGTGKTHAYLIAAALAKRARVNDFWLRGKYNQSYAASAHMPVVISTSSIALQNAIVKYYIPEISNILMKHGTIKTPLSCVVRKGKEHYLCEKNLRTFLKDTDAKTRLRLKPLLEQLNFIDLGTADNLTPYVKRKIGVSGRCGEDCPHYESCRYLRHMQHVQSSEHDFQVCNHNYFLADIIRRSKGQNPLIPHYQAVIIDEAHKFLQAARQMYGVEFDNLSIPQVADDIRDFTYKKGKSSAAADLMAEQLDGQNRRLFSLLEKNIILPDEPDEAIRLKTILNAHTSRHFNNIYNIADELTCELDDRSVLRKYRGRCKQALWELDNIGERAEMLESHDDLVYWLERTENAQSSPAEIKLCAIPKRLNDMLYKHLWNNGIPIILTSGTLSAGGSFEHIKRNMGLYKLPSIMETSKPSPFNHRENALLYISETMPFPNNKDKQYIEAVADEVFMLITASHGHAAILFTSYKVMDMVHEMLSGRISHYPFIRLDRGGVNAIEKFRQSGNGVLFASGAMWEGIDLPGDILSMLVIVKLPFAVPDPISEYEQTLYRSLDEYKNSVVVPEMIIKLKQGFGRLIRSETDTGIVALLDSRVRLDGNYRERVLHALPDCSITANTGDIEAFLKNKKRPDYFV